LIDPTTDCKTPRDYIEFDPSLGSGDVCCGFAYNSGSRDSPDLSLPRKLAFGSLTFNLSGGQLIQDAFHGTNGDKTSKDYDKWASGEEQNLVRRVWDVYKNGPPYPPLPAMPVLEIFKVDELRAATNDFQNKIGVVACFACTFELENCRFLLFHGTLASGKAVVV
jgi:hypothetical protein